MLEILAVVSVAFLCFAGIKLGLYWWNKGSYKLMWASVWSFLFGAAFGALDGYVVLAGVLHLFTHP